MRYLLIFLLAFSGCASFLDALNRPRSSSSSSETSSSGEAYYGEDRVNITILMAAYEHQTSGLYRVTHADERALEDQPAIIDRYRSRNPEYSEGSMRYELEQLYALRDECASSSMQTFPSTAGRRMQSLERQLPRRSRSSEVPQDGPWGSSNRSSAGGWGDGR